MSNKKYVSLGVSPETKLRFNSVKRSFSADEFIIAMLDFFAINGISPIDKDVLPSSRILTRIEAGIKINKGIEKSLKDILEEHSKMIQSIGYIIQKSDGEKLLQSGVSRKSIETLSLDNKRLTEINDNLRKQLLQLKQDNKSSISANDTYALNTVEEMIKYVEAVLQDSRYSRVGEESILFPKRNVTLLISELYERYDKMKTNIKQ